MENYIPKEGNGIIYRYTFENGKKYIGQTKYSLNIRHSQHKRDYTQLIGKAISKYRYELEVIEEVGLDILNDEEIKYIRMEGSLYPNGYNLTTGGQAKHTLCKEVRDRISQGNIGKPKSEIARKRMSVARMGKSPWNKGIPMSEETKKKLSIAIKNKGTSQESIDALKRYYESHSVWNKGKTLPDELKQRISAKLKGQKLSEETKRKMSESRMGKPRSKECISKGIQTRISKGQTVRVKNLDTGKEYDSIGEAQRDTGANNIRLVLNGKMKTSGGYRWQKV